MSRMEAIEYFTKLLEPLEVRPGPAAQIDAPPTKPIAVLYQTGIKPAEYYPAREREFTLQILTGVETGPAAEKALDDWVEAALFDLQDSGTCFDIEAKRVMLQDAFHAYEITFTFLDTDQ